MDLFVEIGRFFLAIYSFIVSLRFMLQLMGVNPSNQVVSGIIKVTDPVLKPLRPVVPRFRKVDLAAIVVTLVLEFLHSSFSVGFGMVSLLLSPLELLSNICTILLVLIIIRVIYSFIPIQTNDLTSLVVEASIAVLRPFRRFSLQIGPFDLTPALVLILLFFVMSYITRMKAYVFDLGLSL